MERRAPVLSAAILILSVVWSGTAASRTPAPPAVLFRTGERASDGMGVASLGPPVSGPSGDVFVHGTTSALLEADGGVLKTIAACGDALPAPFQGVFGSFSQVIVNDAGLVAFTAALDGPGVASGLFLRDGATLTTVSIDEGDTTVGPGTGEFAMNRHGDVVTLSRTAVQRWTRATGATDLLASLPKKGPSRFTDRPAIGDGGHVVWLAVPRLGGPGGVYTWQPGVGVLAVAEDPPGARRSLVGTSNVAVNATGTVAWVSTRTRSSADGAFVWDPGTRVATRLAGQGTVVDGVEITRFGRFVGVDSQGRVVFLARGTGGWRLVQAVGGALTTVAQLGASAGDFPGRLPDSGRVAWIASGEVQEFDGQVESVVTRGDRTPAGSAITASSPSVNDGGAVAFVATHEALFHLVDGVATPVVQAGDSVPGVGSIGTFGAYAAGGGGLGFFASTPDQRPMLVRWSAGRLKAVAVAGVPNPGGPTVDQFAELSDLHLAGGAAGIGVTSFVGDATGAASSAQGVFVARPKGIRLIARRGDVAPEGGRFAAFDVSPVVGDGVAFGAYLEGDPPPYGLFLRKGRFTKRVAMLGQGVPGAPGRVFTAFGAVATQGERVLFVAATGSADPQGLFLWTHGRITRLRTDPIGEGSATDPFLFTGPVALAGRHAVVAGRFVDATALYRAGRGPLRRILGAGDGSVLGGALDLEPEDATDAATFGYAVSPRGDRVTVVAPVVSGRARGAVLSRPLAGGRSPSAASR